MASIGSVTFRVTGAVGASERVVVTGSDPALGSWDISKSIPLEVTSGSPPLWFTPKPVFLPMNVPVEYMYAIMSSADGSARLEHLQHPVSTTTPPPSPALRRILRTVSRDTATQDILGVLSLPAATDSSRLFLTGGGSSGTSGSSSRGGGGGGGSMLLSPSSPITPAGGAMVINNNNTSSGGGGGAVGAATTSSASHHQQQQIGNAAGNSSSSTNNNSTNTTDTTNNNSNGDNVSPVTSSSSSSNSATAPAARAKLTEADGVLIVEYRLPVRLYKRAVTVPSAPSTSSSLSSASDGGLSGGNVAPVAGVTAAGSSIGGSSGADQQQHATSSPTTATTPQSSLTNSKSTANVNSSGNCSSTITRNDDSTGAAATSTTTSTTTTTTYVWVAEWDEEALLAPKGSMARALGQVRVKWIGTPPIQVPPEEEEAVTRALEPMRCIPVFLPPQVHSAYYDGFCRDTLWPIFHNVIDVYGAVPTRWWISGRQSDRWKAYMDANQRFASTVVEQFHDGDMVWVQDYHLLLVPNLLARRHIAPVGLFLHVPFPSSEIFRTLSVRDELLRSVLAADHVGFHLFEYARHFLTSCRRLLGLTHTSKRGGCLSIDYQGREVMVTVSQAGIEPEYLLRRYTGTPGIATSAAEWKAMFPGRAIIAGIDSIERLRGVPHKLLAFESLLDSQPSLAASVVLVLVCIEDTARPGDRQEITVHEIRELAARINARFACSPQQPVVHLSIRSTSALLSERLALWLAADIFFNATIRDSRSLHAFEYVYARGSPACLAAAHAGAVKGISEGKVGADTALQACDSLLAGGGSGPGALILSEFSGCSRVLPGCFRVSPWKLEDMVAAMKHALTMSRAEAAARAEANLQYVRGNTTSSWAERVLVDLKTFSRRGASRTYMGYGLGLGYRLMGFGATFRPLNFEHVLTAYRRSSHRLIVCDYGGTLHVRDSSTIRRHAFEQGLLHGKDAAPPLTADTRRALRLLSEDPRNTVFVISGKEKEVLQKAFASLPTVGLAAEHGYYYRWGAQPQPRKKDGTGSEAAGGGGGGGGGGSGSGTNTPKGAPSSLLLLNAGGGGINSGRGIHRSQSAVSTGGTSIESPHDGNSVSGSDKGGANARNNNNPLVPGGNVIEDDSSSSSGPAGDNGMPWNSLLTIANEDWKAMVGGIMEMYAARTNGTYILRKNSALSWHYADADTEFGSMQAKELQDHLAGVVSSSGYPVDVLSGHDYVEVRPKGVSKGVVLSRIIDALEGRERQHHHHHQSRGSGGTASGGSSGAPSTAATPIATASGSSSSEKGGVGGATPIATATSAAATPNLSSSVIASGGGGSSTKSGGRKPRPLEFILCIGDDLADEEMFTTIVSYRKERWDEHHQRAVVAHVSARKAVVAHVSARKAVVAHVSARKAVDIIGQAGAPTSTSTASVSSSSSAAKDASKHTVGAATSSSATTAPGTTTVAAEQDHSSNAGVAYRMNRFGVGGVLSSVPDESTPVTPIASGSSSTMRTTAETTSSKASQGTAAPGTTPPVNATSISAATSITTTATSAAPTTTATATTTIISSSHPTHPSTSVAPITYYEYTVTVGKKPSSAQYFLDDTQQTEDLLKSLARASLARSRQAAAQAQAAAVAVPLVVSAPPVVSTAIIAATAPAPLTSNATQQQQQPSGGAKLAPQAPKQQLPTRPLLPAISATTDANGAVRPVSHSDLAAMMAFAGSTTNIAGLNTNIVLDPSLLMQYSLGGGGANAALARASTASSSAAGNNDAAAGGTAPSAVLPHNQQQFPSATHQQQIQQLLQSRMSTGGAGGGGGYIPFQPSFFLPASVLDMSAIARASQQAQHTAFQQQQQQPSSAFPHPSLSRNNSSSSGGVGTNVPSSSSGNSLSGAAASAGGDGSYGSAANTSNHHHPQGVARQASGIRAGIPGAMAALYASTSRLHGLGAQQQQQQQQQSASSSYYLSGTGSSSGSNGGGMGVLYDHNSPTAAGGSGNALQRGGGGGQQLQRGSGSFYHQPQGSSAGSDDFSGTAPGSSSTNNRGKSGGGRHTGGRFGGGGAAESDSDMEGSLASDEEGGAGGSEDVSDDDDDDDGGEGADEVAPIHKRRGGGGSGSSGGASLLPASRPIPGGIGGTGVPAVTTPTAIYTSAPGSSSTSASSSSTGGAAPVIASLGLLPPGRVLSSSSFFPPSGAPGGVLAGASPTAAITPATGIAHGVSSGLGQYFENITEDNEDDVPEF